MEIIKSPINYVGNKYKLLPQILPLFPKEIDTFVDVFGGSGTVLINTKAKRYKYNDYNGYVSSIFKGLMENDYDYIIEGIESIIDTYGLTKTNKEGFENLRSDYNNGKNGWVILYTLMCHSFNHQFRFNSKHEYNSSFGKNRSYFSDRQKRDLLAMKERFKDTSNVEITSFNFLDMDFSDFSINDLIYFDPPYLNSVGNYNDGKRGFDGWSEEHDAKLLKILDELDNEGIRFALSNNLKYNNKKLIEWSSGYNVHHLDGNYINSSYNKKDRSKDDEVLITNY